MQMQWASDHIFRKVYEDLYKRNIARYDSVHYSIEKAPDFFDRYALAIAEDDVLLPTVDMKEIDDKHYGITLQRMAEIKPADDGTMLLKLTLSFTSNKKAKGSMPPIEYVFRANPQASQR